MFLAIHRLLMSGPRVLLLAVMGMTATACGGGGPVGPSAAIAPPFGTVAVFITVQRHTGSFTLTLGNQTISTDGEHRFNVPPGLQQVTGQLTGGPPFFGTESGFVSVSFHGLQGGDTGRQGGPRRGSIQSSEGPEAMVSECSLSYSIFKSSATQSSSLKFSFDVSASASDGNSRQREQC